MHARLWKKGICTTELSSHVVCSGWVVRDYRCLCLKLPAHTCNDNFQCHVHPHGLVSLHTRVFYLVCPTTCGACFVCKCSCIQCSITGIWDVHVAAQAVCALDSTHLRELDARRPKSDETSWSPEPYVHVRRALRTVCTVSHCVSVRAATTGRLYDRFHFTICSFPLVISEFCARFQR